MYSKASSDSYENNYNANSGKYGDAVYETSSKASGWAWDFSWYGDYSEFPSGAFPFFIRGNAYDRHTNAGVYSFAGTHSAGNYSFRPVLVIF